MQGRIPDKETVEALKKDPDMALEPGRLNPPSLMYKLDVAQGFTGDFIGSFQRDLSGSVFVIDPKNERPFVTGHLESRYSDRVFREDTEDFINSRETKFEYIISIYSQKGLVVASKKSGSLSVTLNENDEGKTIGSSSVDRRNFGSNFFVFEEKNLQYNPEEEIISGFDKNLKIKRDEKGLINGYSTYEMIYQEDGTTIQTEKNYEFKPSLQKPFESDKPEDIRHMVESAALSKEGVTATGSIITTKPDGERSTQQLKRKEDGTWQNDGEPQKTDPPKESAPEIQPESISSAKPSAQAQNSGMKR